MLLALGEVLDGNVRSIAAVELFPHFVEAVGVSAISIPNLPRVGDLGATRSRVCVGTAAVTSALVADFHRVGAAALTTPLDS